MGRRWRRVRCRPPAAAQGRRAAWRARPAAGVGAGQGAGVALAAAGVALAAALPAEMAAICAALRMHGRAWPPQAAASRPCVPREVAKGRRAAEAAAPLAGLGACRGWRRRGCAAVPLPFPLLRKRRAMVPGAALPPAGVGCPADQRGEGNARRLSGRNRSGWIAQRAVRPLAPRPASRRTPQRPVWQPAGQGFASGSRGRTPAAPCCRPGKPRAMHEAAPGCALPCRGGRGCRAHPARAAHSAARASPCIGGPAALRRWHASCCSLAGATRRRRQACRCSARWTRRSAG